MKSDHPTWGNPAQHHHHHHPGLGSLAYYVSPTGNDTNPGTESAPFRTINKALSVMSVGNSLYLMPGEYREGIVNPPGGVSLLGQRGSILRPSGQHGILFASAASSDIVLDGLVIDASGCSEDGVKITWGSTTGTSQRITIRNSEVYGSQRQGILITGDGSHYADSNQILNCSIHDNGKTDFDHGLYISTSGNLVEGNDVYANAGWGVHIYDGGNYGYCNKNMVRGNRVHNNARVGNRGFGIGLYSGAGHLAESNIVEGNHGGVDVDYGAVGCVVQYNSFSANGPIDIRVGPGSTDAVISGNGGASIDNQGVNTTISAVVVKDDRPIVPIEYSPVDYIPAPMPPVYAMPPVYQSEVEALAIPDVLRQTMGPAVALSAEPPFPTWVKYLVAGFIIWLVLR